MLELDGAEQGGGDVTAGLCGPCAAEDIRPISAVGKSPASAIDQIPPLDTRSQWKPPHL